MHFHYLTNDCTYFSEDIGIDMLEHFVETELAQSLHRVPKERWSPALPQSTDTGFPQGHAETVDDSTVLSRVHLNTALDQIERHDGRVCDATAQYAAEPTQCIVLR